jgi:glycosyltransferase involved in cell wall biosynthesis
VKPRAQKTWRVPNPIRRRFFEEAGIGATAAAQQELRTQPGCVITNIGVISPRKRQLELIDVVGRLRKRGLEFRVDFVGDSDNSPYAQQFFERAKTLGDSVRHRGLLSTEQVIAQLDSSAGLIHFPLEEAFGLVVCEALSRGLKLFGSRTGGIPDIASGLPGAELFDVEDWTGLEEALASWIDGGFQRPSGSIHIMRERYHPSVVARQHVEIYREVLSMPS